MDDEEMKFVGGILCLDFVNTVDAWASPPGEKHPRDFGDTPLREKLIDYDALVRWAQLGCVIGEREADRLLSRAAEHATDAAAILTRALKLRLAVYRIVKSLLERWEPRSGDLETLHREIVIARRHEKLSYSDGTFLWTWDEPQASLDRILWPVALSTADLLISNNRDRLRQCLGDECGWLFLDLSRNRSRNWCDMKDCGNLSKVRRFRLKH